MVKVRLTRTGAKKAPFYRVIVTDSRAARNSAFLEVVGYYDPIKNPEVIHLKKERIEYWVSVGAQLSDTVASLVRRHARAAGAATQA